MMGDWYIVKLSDLLGVDKASTYIKLINGDLVPEYSPLNCINNNVMNKYAIDSVLIKQIDSFGKQFREMSSNIMLGSTDSSEPISIKINKYKPATDEELMEYIDYMQQVCDIVITRFDVLRYELSNAYELYRPVLDKVKTKIKMRHFNKVKSSIPKLIGYTVVDKSSKEKIEMHQRLSLLKSEKDNR